ncbi:alpha/beta hydrolase family esterase [Sphingobacterium athyrii]|uniref:Poly(3-hydroxybutyrate) depolymerase n=1 Tax=Sphingobacterium athyrii TaxID=2152717 RepID=A0A363NPJ3_9SPHI|nr:hypothetical protein [Sphingobacterium athyrii]PUV22716.1 hypothetical protein DCO56_21205 [Sphingobacterium athyrii]
MKKIFKEIYFSFLLLSLFSFSACVKDTSLYLSQNKKEVNVDDYDKDGTGPGAVEGELTPGVQLVKLKVTYNGKETERRFKYFMPVSIVKSKPISLIFNFHGSYGTGSDPIAGVSMSDPLAQLAIRENCIIVFPAGEDTGAAVNWQNSDYHFPFVDAMVNYFKTHTPLADENRIYTCGQSSGAIFSFVLAYYRSEVFAAAVPVSGQMKLVESNLPVRAVPIRAFNGKNDDIVVHSAALENINAWANLVGGYFASDAAVSDTLKIDNYKSYMTRKWNGGKADIEFYTILDEGHGVSWYYIAPLMWEFMNTHPKNAASTNIYLSSQLKRFDAVEGQPFSSEIRCNQGAVLSLVAAPSDWTVTLSGNTLKVKAPNDFFAATTVNRKGEIKLRAQYNGKTAELSLPYSLAAPKTFFELGDLVYDADFKPTGVVFWVNSTNVKEAKIIALEHTARPFGAVGTAFFTPNPTDGYGNTLALVERNKEQNLGLNAATSGFMYAYEYKAGAGKTAGWYLPAVDELKLVDANLTAVNNAIKANAGTVLDISSATGSYHLSSTVTNSAGKKLFNTFDFNTNPSWHGYYNIAANTADNSPNVSTRPIKRVTK